MRFRDKAVLIVGAGSGLGAATAQAFAAEGARLVLVDLDAHKVASVAAQVGKAAPIAGDASVPETARRACAALGGPADVLVVTAGIDPHDATDVLGTSVEDWDRIMQINVRPAFLFARAVLPGMIVAGGGAIVLTGSISGLKPTPREAAYSVSKAAVIQLARAIALDHAHEGVRANCICPGYLEAVMQDRAQVMTAQERAQRHAAAAAAVPMGREGRYGEMAQLALFLSDPRAAGYITGQAVAADGGSLLK